MRIGAPSLGGLAFVALLGLAAPAAAQGGIGGNAFVHVVRPGENLASIAQRYYGEPRRESVLVAENGLTIQGGAAIVVGMRLIIPWVSYHTVRAGETWGQIAVQHYGDARRIYALTEANPQVVGSQPDEGAEVLIPYPLRHVAGQRESVARVAQLYYGDVNRAMDLRRFNNNLDRRVPRGQVVLVPLPDLVLSEEGRRLVAEATGRPPETGRVRDRQGRVNAQLLILQEHVHAGRYTNAVALGNRILGGGQLSFGQIVTIYREMAEAYVALDREDLAIRAFQRALERQPHLELDTRATSPRVLDAFHRAQERGRAQQADAGVADLDGGVPADGAVPADAGVPAAERPAAERPAAERQQR